MTSTSRYITASVALLAIALVGYLAFNYFSRSDDPTPVVISHGEADIGGPFELVDTKGTIFADQNLKGRFALVYFGFTHCPDVCPLDMNRISMALTLMEKEGDFQADLQPVFITVDPLRDTPRVVADYLEGYHPSFVGLTGTQAQMEVAAKAYKVYWEEVLSREHDDHQMQMAENMTMDERENLEPILINHSAYIYLMDRDGKYVTHYDSQVPASKLAEDLLDRLD